MAKDLQNKLFEVRFLEIANRKTKLLVEWERGVQILKSERCLKGEQYPLDESTLRD